ncbi:MAG TPA: hypothetical protein VHA15_13755 [Burkholderiales bacterium]|jgi:hypothetical protein|nr:hypothetical protein [Burkholderiales bacterium]
MTSLSRNARALAAGLALLSCPILPAAAESTSAGTRPDALEFRMRGELRDEYVDHRQGGGSNMLVPRLDYAVTPAISVRVEAPLVTSGPELAGESNQSGFGDLLFRGSFRVSRGPGYALVVGAEALLDTASKDSLGYGKQVLAPLVYASIEVPRCRSVLFPFAQRFFTVGGDASRPDVDYTLLKAAMLTRWPDRLYTVVEPQVVVDHERSDRVGAMLEVEAGRFLDRRTTIFARPGIGLHGGDLPQAYDWNFKVGVRYSF